MNIDLSSLDAAIAAQEEGEILTIRHPYTGEETDAKIRVASSESERVKSAIRPFYNKFYQKREAKRKIEDLEELIKIQVAASIISWTGIEINGKPFEYSSKNAHFLIDKYPGFLEQIKEFSEERDSFLPK